MSRSWPLVAGLGALVLGGTLSRVQGQAQSQNVEQQLRSQYRIASVGSNGVVVRAGSVVVVQQDGITAFPAPGEWPCNSYKQGSRIKQSTICAVNYSISKNRTRHLQAGEKAYLTGIQVKPSEVVFRVQTCSGDANDVPFRAAVSFQFQKGYLDVMNIKQIRDTIDGVFAVDTSGTTEQAASPPPGATGGASPTVEREQPPPPPSPPPPVAPLKLPSTYVSAQAPADRLQLNADNSFSLEEAGQPYRGTFTVNGNTLELNITDGPKTTVARQGSNLTDSSGQTWVLREQSAATAPSGAMLQNGDIIKMAKAGFDDAIIIAKISNSKCQFDTSTDALIRLKQSGVSATVLKAVVGAGR